MRKRQGNKPSHHRVSLLLRCEPEGHGILFIDAPDAPTDNLKAVALLDSHEMEDHRVERALREECFTSENLAQLATAMQASKVEEPLTFAQAVEKVTAERVDEMREEEAQIRGQTILNFIRWLFDKYSISAST